jgi:hypothetical protein
MLDQIQVCNLQVYCVLAQTGRAFELYWTRFLEAATGPEQAVFLFLHLPPETATCKCAAPLKMTDHRDGFIPRTLTANMKRKPDAKHE